jgi:hypothetical protein
MCQADNILHQMRHGKSRNIRAGCGIPEKRGGLWDAGFIDKTGET